MSGEPFLFGKMPAHGDFVARGLAGEERQALDDWLSAQMVAVRETLGEDFAERFDVAPPWCFTWAEERGWTAGALAPSVDGVGRRFPLMVAVRGIDREAARASAEQCVEAIFGAVGEAWDADRLVEAAVPVDGSGDASEGWWTEGGEGFEPASLPGRWPGGLMAAMLATSGVTT